MATAADTPRDREARFLAARSTRAAEREAAREHIGSESSSSSRDRFWAAFRGRCSSLHRRIDALSPGKDGERAGDDDDNALGRYVTAAQRNAGREEINSVSGEVGALRRMCGLGATARTAAADDEGGENDEAIDRDVVASLPPGDVRLLAEEFSRLSARIDEAREVVCPREVFTFKRYRAAMAERERRQKEGGNTNGWRDRGDENSPSSDGLDSGKENKSGLEYERQQFGMTLENQKDCRVTVEVDGTVLSFPLNEEIEKNGAFVANVRPDALDASSATSFLIRDLSNCCVALKGMYRSIHLLELQACEVSVASPIAGPIHITSCHDTIFRVACHQLRMHDCTKVKCHVHVKAGPIIEGCKGITFYGDYHRHFPPSGRDVGEGENKFRDVKDFDWLRTMVKSPNFEVVELTPDVERAASVAPDMIRPSDRGKGQDVNKQGDGSAASGGWEALNVTSSTSGCVEDDSSEEDEL